MVRKLVEVVGPIFVNRKSFCVAEARSAVAVRLIKKLERIS